MRRKLFAAPFVLAFVVMACEWDPRRPLEHYAPLVDDALGVLAAGDAAAAAAVLTPYLETTQCDKGQIAISNALREKERAGLDLGLLLFHVAESYGQRFADDDHAKPPEGVGADHVTCALAVVRELGERGTSEDRARAAFVEGNLLFFNGAYKEAVLAYDRSLLWWPPAEGDDQSMAANVAFNRAIALKRSEQEPDAGSDASDSDGSSDASDNDAASDGSSPSDASSDDENDAGSQDQPDAESQPPDSGTPPPKDQDAGESDDAGTPPPPPEETADAGLNQPPPEAMERLLDDLERAPSVQQEIIRRERHKRIRPEEDK